MFILTFSVLIQPSCISVLFKFISLDHFTLSCVISISHSLLLLFFVVKSSIFLSLLIDFLFSIYLFIFFSSSSSLFLCPLLVSSSFSSLIPPSLSKTFSRVISAYLNCARRVGSIAKQERVEVKVWMRELQDLLLSFFPSSSRISRTTLIKAL